MRIAITTSTASVASAAIALWPMSRSPAKARSCCAMTATAASSPPSASPARRPSCQVGAGRLERCSLFLVPGLQGPSPGQQGRELDFCSPATLSLHRVGQALGLSGRTAGS